MQLIEIIHIGDIINPMLQEHTSIKMAYKLVKLHKFVETQSEFYISELNKIVQEYCQRDENGEPLHDASGQSILIQIDKLEECHKRVSDLENFEVDIPDIQFELNDFEGLNLTPVALEPLFPFIKI